MLKSLVGLLMVSALSGGGAVAQQTPSAPIVPVPNVSVQVPTVLAGDIADLATAPPITIAAILRLANLGAYPFAEGFLADPNQPASDSDLAFVLVNLFAPAVNGEFPVPAEAARAYVEGQLTSADDTDTETSLAETSLAETPLAVGGENSVVTGEEALQALVAVLQLSLEAEAAVRFALIEQFPAFSAGNFDIVLTRGALALFGSLALDAVQTQSNSASG